jgi:hypothetical protein
MRRNIKKSVKMSDTKTSLLEVQVLFNKHPAMGVGLQNAQETCASEILTPSTSNGTTQSTIDAIAADPYLLGRSNLKN